MKPQIDFKEFEQFLQNEFNVNVTDTKLFEEISKVITKNPKNIQGLIGSELIGSIGGILNFTTGIEVGMRYMAYQFNKRPPAGVCN